MNGCSQNFILGSSDEIFLYSRYSNSGQNLTQTANSSYEHQHAPPCVSKADAYRSVSATAAEHKYQVDFFYIQWSVHNVMCVNNYPTRCNNIPFIYICNVSGGIFTHHQVIISLYLQYLALLRPLLIPVVNVSFMTGSSNSLSNARYCRYTEMSS